MNKLSFFVLLGLIVFSFARADVFSDYQYSYVQQMIPFLKQKFAQSLIDGDVTENEIVESAKKMAGCQLEVIAIYPQEYQDASINPVVEGESIMQVRSDLNTLMQADLHQGKLSMNEFKQIIAEATEKYRRCMK